MGEHEKRQHEPIVSFGPYRLDVENFQLWRGVQEVRVTGKAFAVLRYLVEHPGQLAMKDDLFTAAWPETVVSEATLVSGIQELRQALRDDAKNPRYIETVHRRGYRFIGKVVRSEQGEVSKQEPLANGQEADSVMPAQAGSQESHAQVSGESPWIPAFAGMTSPPSSPQTHNPSLQLDQTPEGSLDEAQRNPGEKPETESRIALRSIQATEPPGAGVPESHAQALGESPWIPADAGMTPLPSFPQNDVDGGQESALSSLSSHPEQPLDASTRPAQRAWSVRSLVIMSLVLLVGTILTVQYLSRPSLSTQSSVLSTAAPQALPLPDKPSIIILPFTNMSGDPGQDYFSDGLTEVLTTDLSQISSLFVIARNSAFTYKGKAAKVQDVSREMGVRYVLEGGVLRTEGQVRITAQLIDATTGYHLWAERYDRPFREIFALQDELVQKIVTTLNLQISLQEQGGFLVRRTTANLEAYDAFLRGVGYAVRLARETNPQARQMYEHAIALDPQYAEAYAGLGWTYYWEWIYQWNPDPQNVERAEELARQALALNDRLSLAHGLLSRIYSQKQQPELAVASAEQAVAFAPNYAEAHIWWARALMAVDRPAEALRDIEQAMRLNPRYPFWYPDDLANAYYLLGRYEEAIAAHQQTLLRNPRYQFAYVYLVLNYAQAWLWQQRQEPQTPAQALEAAQRAVALNASSSAAHVALGVAALLNKHYVQAEAEVERILALNPGSADLYASVAGILNWVGRPAEAVGLMEQALHLNPRLPSWYFLFLGQAYYLLGRTKEAVEPLQRVLSVYPHRVEAHVLLAAIYSELGQTAEARAEVAEVLRLNSNFSLAVHKERMPIKDPMVLERHIAALRKAGLK